MVVCATLLASLLAILACAGLLQQAGASQALRRAATAFISVSLAIGQPQVAAGLAERLQGALRETRVVSIGLLVSSWVLLALAVVLWEAL